MNPGLVINYLNVLVSGWSIWVMLKKIFKDEGIRTFTKMWSWFDLIYCILVPWIAISDLV